ncbi:hypothetical protein BGZ95_004085 [Linnemannia exigua]|uniref:Uncharacterized protein n=1 Tax=Linnemannia exigua TaxID=604196 RepID=A0AAD4D3F0_9FUNG|nr:hypothetical protein BGZ95_004085 [Linnemannia exigua]
MRLPILSTASVLLLLALFTFQAQSQGQAPYPTTPVRGNISDSACQECRAGLIIKINPECPEALKVDTNDSDYPVEDFKKLPLMTRTCRCAMASPGFLAPCAGSDICGPTSRMVQSNLDGTAQICALLKATEEAASKNVGSRTVVGAHLSAGLAVAVVAAVATIAF